MTQKSFPVGEGPGRQHNFAGPGLDSINLFAELAGATLRWLGTPGDEAFAEDLAGINGINTVTGVQPAAFDVCANDFGNRLRKVKNGNAIGSRGAFERLQLGCLRNMKLHPDCPARVRVGVANTDQTCTKLGTRRS